MQFPESWLRNFCNPPISTTDLASLLTMAGLEVEDLRPVAPPFSRVVVGEIVEAEQHPNADRLRVCRVDAGPHSKDGPLQIVCGAPNARVGIKVPLALVGAELPPAEADAGPFQIKLGKLRGVESQGMLCSARELKLSDDHGGLLELDSTVQVGADVRDVLQLDDTLFTLKLTPNLGRALSVYGIAREVAALTGAPLVTPQFPPVAAQLPDVLPVQVQAPDLCGRFSGRIIRNVNTQARTPAWMVDPPGALRPALGHRIGRHLELRDVRVRQAHAHLRPRQDPRRPAGALGQAGRDAEAAERQHRRARCAGRRDRRWPGGGVAGRHHGRRCHRRVRRHAARLRGGGLLVARCRGWPWTPLHNFSTDAGHRFERGVDPAGTVEHIEHITRLILDICGTPETACGPIDDQQPNLPQHAPVTLRVARAAKVIGMPIDQQQCAAVFRRLGLQFTEGEGSLTVTPPSWRFDLVIEEDLIEEVARVIGYDTLPTDAPLAPITPRVRPEASRGSFAVRRAIAALDYQETINFSFVEARWESELHGNADPIRVLNPIAAPLSVMRSSLIGSLVQVLRHNLARKAARVRVFEVGRVARRDASVAAGALSVAGIDQPLRVAGLAYGPVDGTQWGSAERAVDFFDVKGDVQALLAPLLPRFEAADHPAFHPGRSARVLVDGVQVGVLGELHPRWRHAYELPQAPLLFELDLAAVQARPLPAATAIARHQAAMRDLALVVPDATSHDRLVDALRSDPSSLVRSATLFDVYKPAQPTGDMAAGERSLAVRLELLDAEATLTEERIDAAVAAAVSRAANVGARLRA